MSSPVIALLVGLVLGGLLSIYVTPRSLREEKVYGGTPAQVFHYLGVLGFCMTVPTVLTSVILHSGFLPAVALGFGCVGAAFVALLVFAVLEHPARAGIASDEDEVWTEEKARFSGL